MKKIFQISAAQGTHTGRKRSHNEDFVGFFEPTEERLLLSSGCLYVVADGVGGGAWGERASRYAVQTLLYEYYRRADVPPAERLVQIIQEINSAIYSYSLAEAAGRAVATTLVAAVVWHDQLIVANVGDSRAYLVRDGRVEQITHDHNLTHEMRRTGVMTETEILNAKIPNRLVRSLGGRPHTEVDIFTQTLQTDDRIILCSDGLTRYITAWDLLRLTEPYAPEEAVQTLIAYANAQGGADNISVIVVDIGLPTTLEAWTSSRPTAHLPSPTTPHQWQTAPPPPTKIDEEVVPQAPPPAQQHSRPPKPAQQSTSRQMLWLASGLLLLAGLLLGGALWWFVRGGSFTQPASTPLAVTVNTPAPLPSSTPLLPTNTPLPTATPKPTATSLASGPHGCLYEITPGDTLYGTLYFFDLINNAARNPFWSQQVAPGHLRTIYYLPAGSATHLEEKPLDYPAMQAIPVPQQSPSTAPHPWERFEMEIASALKPGGFLYLPGIDFDTCIERGGRWQAFLRLPPP